MTAVALTPTTPAALGELEREVLARIDRGGLSICEAELRHTLCWDDSQGELLDVLAELESRGLLESALHFRLTDRGRERLPDGYEPPFRVRVGAGIPWQVAANRGTAPASAGEGPGMIGTVYLLHLDPGLRVTGGRVARHYIGWNAGTDVQSRLEAHLAGRGSPLVAAVIAAGGTVTLARTWPQGRPALRAQAQTPPRGASHVPALRGRRAHQGPRPAAHRRPLDA